MVPPSSVQFRTSNRYPQIGYLQACWEHREWKLGVSNRAGDIADLGKTELQH